VPFTTQFKDNKKQPNQTKQNKTKQNKTTDVGRGKGEGKDTGVSSISFPSLSISFPSPSIFFPSPFFLPKGTDIEGKDIDERH